jgi:hypothetical protein
MSQIIPSLTTFQVPPISFEALVEQLQRTGPQLDEERRSEGRHVLHVPVEVFLLDWDRHPLGIEMTAITRDMSPHSLGLITPQSVESPIIFVRITNKGFDDQEFLLEVRRSKKLGPFFDVGGRFILD